MTTPMHLRPPERVLDLTERDSARSRVLVVGSTVWFREDVRIADGVSRVVPAVFGGYSWRKRRCSIFRSHVNVDREFVAEWVALDDVIVRHFADPANDSRPRLAMVGTPLAPVDPGSAPVLVALAFAGVLVLLVFWLWGFR